MRCTVGGDTFALTFDDGPDPDTTPAVLDALERLGAPATFFLVGTRVDQHPELVRRMVDAGHAVGSHSATHPEPWTVGLGALLRDYQRGRASLEAVIRRPAPLFRPPKGFLDLRGAVAARRAGLRTWLWTIDPEDWRPGATPEDIVGWVADLRGGDVILLHDALEQPLQPSALDRTSTVDALGEIVAAGKERGLRPVVLT